MDYKHTKNERKTERGNVLFLILIAVALFAALSYAVTQSTRGGGNADDETSLISSASLTQYPASLKTTILRMSITSGVADSELMFNPPSDQTDCAADPFGVAACVFNGSGGAGSYQQAPADIMSGGSAGTWVFSGENDIFNIGVNATVADTPDAASVDVIAFLPGITSGICQKINDELDITGIPTETGIDVSTQLDDTTNGSALPSGAGGGTIGNDVAALDGHPFGCFQQPASTYIYYHALSEN